MKKLLTVLTVLFSMTFAGVALAEEPVAAPAGGLDLKAGTLFAGGTIGYFSQTTSPDEGDDVEMSSLIFSPSVGYFITPELAAMGTLTYRSDSDGDDDMSTIGLWAGAKYHMPMGPVYLWGSGELGLEMMSTEGMDMTHYGLRLGVGILYPFNPHVALEAGLKFSYLMGSWEAEGGFDGDYTRTELGIGYLGFVGFFNL